MKKLLALVTLALAIGAAAPAMAQPGHFRGPMPGNVYRGPVHGPVFNGPRYDYDRYHGYRGGYRGGYEYRRNPVVPFLFGFGLGALTAPRYVAPPPVYYDYDYDYDYDYVPLPPPPPVYRRPLPPVIVVPPVRGNCGCW